MSAHRTTGIHGQRIMSVLSSAPFLFTFERSKAKTGAGVGQLVGTSKAAYCTTTTIVIRGDRDDVDVIEVSVASGPLEYVKHTQLGFGIMSIVAKLASSDVLSWLEGELPALKAADGLRTTDIGRLRLALRTQQINAATLQVVFTISPSTKEPPAGTIERIPYEEPA